MSELQMEADGMPAMTPEARAAFARLTHATAHEAMTLRTLNARIRSRGLTTVEQVHALVAEMLTERAHRIGMDPDLVSDAHEAATVDRLLDMAVLGQQVRHA